jgi:hypothetical protein
VAIGVKLGDADLFEKCCIFLELLEKFLMVGKLLRRRQLVAICREINAARSKIRREKFQIISPAARQISTMVLLSLTPKTSASRSDGGKHRARHCPASDVVPKATALTAGRWLAQTQKCGLWRTP